MIVLLTVMEKFGGLFVADASTLLDAYGQRVSNLCLNLERGGVIVKKTIPRKKGRLVRMSINPDIREIVVPLLEIVEGEEIQSYIDKYQAMVDNKQLMSDKWNV